MRDLPQGWTLARLPDVCELNPGKPNPSHLASETQVTFVPMSAVDADLGQITKPIVRPYGEVSKGFTAFQENDVIMAKITPCMENGKAAIARGLSKGVGFGSTEFHVFRNSKALLPEYLFYFIRQDSFRKAAEATMTGSVGQKRVPVDFFKDTILPLAPLNEQRRIVTKLEILLTHVDSVKARLANIPHILKRFRQSVLAAACSGRLTSDWREENNANTKSWPGVLLKDVASLRLGKMLDKAKNLGDPTAYLRNLNVRWFTFDLNDLALIRATLKDKQELSLRNGDLLVCEGGEPGRCAVWTNGEADLVFQKALHRVRLNGRVLPDWLAMTIKNDADSGGLEDYFTGSTIQHLTGRSLANYEFRVPPLDEQKEIVRRVEALFRTADALEARYRTAKAHVDKLTQSILSKAFRGDLVPQDPNDEPASALLTRINGRNTSKDSQVTKRRGK